LKSRGGAGRKQQQSRRRPQVSAICQFDQSLTGAGIGDLIMVLEKIDALMRIDVQRRPT
jgi:hypothetical protein